MGTIDVVTDMLFYPDDDKNEVIGNQLMDEIIAYKKEHGTCPPRGHEMFSRYRALPSESVGFEYDDYPYTPGKIECRIGFFWSLMDMCWRSDTNPVWDCR
jgi:hypothetical protein